MDQQKKNKKKNQKKRSAAKNKNQDDVAVTHVAVGGPVVVPLLDDGFRRLRLLMEKAKAYLMTKGARLRYSPHFYRDKSAPYYFDIIHRRSGIMAKYKKDFHGDPLSPINGVLDGLFFSVNTDLRGTGVLQPTSIYGEMRLIVPAATMLCTPFNLYFTDFYCRAKDVHYVTLVMTKPGSAADRFCFSRLVLLDWQTNPFLRLYTAPCPYGLGWTPVMHVTSGVWVEVFYTEDISVPEVCSGGAVFMPVRMVGQRSGGTRGLPKNQHCTKCNV